VKDQTLPVLCRFPDGLDKSKSSERRAYDAAIALVGGDKRGSYTQAVGLDASRVMVRFFLAQ
jgi:hypothetical protein